VNDVTSEAFRAAMRRLAAGVTVITTRHNGVQGGLTATAVCSLTADPPQILVCVNRSASAHSLIAEGGNLCVNLLARRHQGIANRFAGAARNEDRFADGKWTTLVTGAPALADALANFDCVVREKVETSTHTIYIGRVVDVQANGDGEPLLYASGSYAAVKKLPAPKKKKA
jgi:flavin reductase (DIM6/NTAB) family NADH-FMN oxidoreductase RutF